LIKDVVTRVTTLDERDDHRALRALPFSESLADAALARGQHVTTRMVLDCRGERRDAVSLRTEPK
jgi:hypothetical protein